MPTILQAAARFDAYKTAVENKQNLVIEGLTWSRFWNPAIDPVKRKIRSGSKTVLTINTVGALPSATRMFNGIRRCSPDKHVGIYAPAGIPAVQVCPNTCPACKKTSNL